MDDPNNPGGSGVPPTGGEPGAGGMPPGEGQGASTTPVGGEGAGAGAGGTPQPSTPPSGLSPDDIARIVESTVRAVQPSSSAPQQQLTQEQIDAALKVFRPTSKMVEALRAGGEEAVLAMQEMAQGIYEQANTMAQYQMQLLMERMSGDLGPIQAYVAEQRQNALRAEFLTKYPHLKDYEPLCAAVRDQLVRERATFPNKEAAYAEVAKRTEALLKTLPNAGAAGAGKPAGAPGHNMSTLTGGGQGGAGGTGRSKPVTAGMAVFQ